MVIKGGYSWRGDGMSKSAYPTEIYLFVLNFYNPINIEPIANLKLLFLI